MDTPNFEDEFERAVADWRDRHRLREDDAVLLLVDLFRIHQRHWDDLRRREFPSFEQFRGDIAKLTESSGKTLCVYFVVLYMLIVRRFLSLFGVRCKYLVWSNTKH